MKLMEQLEKANATNILLESKKLDEAPAPYIKELDPEELRRVKELRDQGLHAREIAAELNMDDGKVNVLLKHVDSEVQSPRGENMRDALTAADGEDMKNKLMDRLASIRGLAREYMTDENTVRKMIIKAGLTSDQIKQITGRADVDSAQRPLDRNTFNVAVELWADGETVAEICRTLGVNDKSLSSRIRKLPNFEELRLQHNASIGKNNQAATGNAVDPNAPPRAPKQPSWRELPEPTKRVILAKYKKGIDPDSIAWDFEKAGDKTVGRGTVNSFIDHQPNAVELKQEHVAARRKRLVYNR
jgi:hypothetical protein